jgi:hypothetical protein
MSPFGTQATSMPLDSTAIATLSRVTTATLTTILLKKGLRNVVDGVARAAAVARASAHRWAGVHAYASFRRGRTSRRLRRGPNPISTRAAIEAMPAGCASRVVDAMGHHRCGDLRRHPLCAHGQARRLRRS